MLARRSIPASYRAWNRRWGAPYGRATAPRKLAQRVAPRLTDRFPAIRGPFGIQPNNQTRRFEYPWAYHATPLHPGMRVVEIGGGLSGFQFVLAKEGLDVWNIDPGEDASGVGWPCDHASISRLNRAFRTDVKLANTTIEGAGISDASIDRVFSISAIEHIPSEELPELAEHVHRILAPGGQVVLTIDLFLDLRPFSHRERNRFGHNIDVKRLVDMLQLDMRVGRPSELNGYPDFDPKEVLGQLPTLVYGMDHPACVQLLVLEKPITERPSARDSVPRALGLGSDPPPRASRRGGS